MMRHPLQPLNPGGEADGAKKKSRRESDPGPREGGRCFQKRLEMTHATVHITPPVRPEHMPIEIVDGGLTSSWVSTPQRDNRWGDPQFRGNCDGTLFRDLILRYDPKSVADPMMGSGTTQDVVADLNRETGGDIRYWGSDLSMGFNLQTMNLPGRFDFIWVHPPYWDIIAYSGGVEGDLSCIGNFETFCDVLIRCLQRCVVALNPGGYLAVLVGDIRRCGQYYSMLKPLLECDTDLGQLRSIIIKAQHHTASSRKRYRMPDPPIHHEYCLLIRETESERSRPVER